MEQAPGPRAYGARARALRAESGKSTSAAPSPMAIVRNFVAFVICAFIWRSAFVVEVMLTSERVNRPVLNLSLACYALLFAVLMYFTWYIPYVDPAWSDNEKYNKHIQFATLTMVIGGTLWTVAMWPVFHIWTLPLGIVGAVLAVTSLTLLTLLSPATWRKKKRMH